MQEGRGDRDEALGPPDLALCGFSLWVHTAAASVEPYEDWLNVTALCGADGASVRTSGEILLRREVAGWLRALDALHTSLTGVARLQPLQPNLDVLVEVDRVGGLKVTVEITPNQLTQRHQFIFQADQSYLPPLLQQGRALMRRLDAVQR